MTGVQTCALPICRAKDAPELIKGACGMAFDARYYCSYLQDKFTTLYEL